jgi:hypothetical protein
LFHERGGGGMKMCCCCGPQDNGRGGLVSSRCGERHLRRRWRLASQSRRCGGDLVD